MQRQLIPLIEDLSHLGDGAEVDFIKPERMATLNYINDIIITINNYHLIRRVDIAKQLQHVKTKLHADGPKDLEDLREELRLAEAFTGMKLREKLITCFESDDERKKMERRLGDAGKVAGFRRLNAQFQTYSGYAHLTAAELAAVAYLIDRLIHLVHQDIKNFQSTEVQDKLKQVLAGLYAARSDVAICMRMHQEAYEASYQDNHDILLPVARRLNDIVGSKFIELAHDAMIDRSFNEKLINPFSTSGSEALDITVQAYFSEYCKLEAEPVEPREKVKKALAITKQPAQQGMLSWLSFSTLTAGVKSLVGGSSVATPPPSPKLPVGAALPLGEDCKTHISHVLGDLEVVFTDLFLNTSMDGLVANNENAAKIYERRVGLFSFFWNDLVLGLAKSFNETVNADTLQNFDALFQIDDKKAVEKIAQYCDENGVSKEGFVFQFLLKDASILTHISQLHYLIARQLFILSGFKPSSEKSQGDEASSFAMAIGQFRFTYEREIPLYAGMDLAAVKSDIALFDEVAAELTTHLMPKLAVRPNPSVVLPEPAATPAHHILIALRGVLEKIPSLAQINAVIATASAAYEQADRHALKDAQQNAEALDRQCQFTDMHVQNAFEELSRIFQKIDTKLVENNQAIGDLYDLFCQSERVAFLVQALVVNTHSMQLAGEAFKKQCQDRAKTSPLWKEAVQSADQHVVALSKQLSAFTANYTKYFPEFEGAQLRKTQIEKTQKDVVQCHQSLKDGSKRLMGQWESCKKGFREIDQQTQKIANYKSNDIKSIFSRNWWKGLTGGGVGGVIGGGLVVGAMFFVPGLNIAALVVAVALVVVGLVLGVGIGMGVESNSKPKARKPYTLNGLQTKESHANSQRVAAGRKVAPNPGANGTAIAKPRSACPPTSHAQSPHGLFCPKQATMVYLADVKKDRNDEVDAHLPARSMPIPVGGGRRR